MVLGGCGPELPEPYPVTWEGRHVELAVAPDLPVCAGTLAATDEIIAGLRRDMGYAPLVEKIRYYYVTPDDIESLGLCSSQATACVFYEPAVTVYAPSLPHLHELGHAVRGDELRRRERLATPIFFEEALAHSYGFEAVRRPTRNGVGVAEALESIASAPFDASLYEPASHFVSYLDERYGKQTVVEFIDSMGPKTDSAALRAAFEEHTGDSLRFALEGYADYPPCSKFSQSSHPFECARPPVPADADGIVRVDTVLDCDDAETIGPVHGKMWRTFVFEVRDSGRYAIDLAGAPGHPGFRWEVTSCAARCSTPVDFSTKGPEAYVSLELPAGKYVIRVSGSPTDPGPVEIRVLPPDSDPRE